MSRWRAGPHSEEEEEEEEECHYLGDFQTILAFYHLCTLVFCLFFGTFFAATNLKFHDWVCVCEIRSVILTKQSCCTEKM
jgi:hypothetical protein